MGFSLNTYVCQAGCPSFEELTEGRPESLECPSCGALASRAPGGHPTKASYPDGTRRFDGLRRRRSVEGFIKIQEHRLKQQAKVDREGLRDAVREANNPKLHKD